MRARTSSWLMPSTVATRTVVAPVRRASATTSRSSARIGANARPGAARSASRTARSASVVASSPRRREHHTLRDLLGHGLVAGRRVGSGVDEGQAVHEAMTRRLGVAAIDRRGERGIVRKVD